MPDIVNAQEILIGGQRYRLAQGTGVQLRAINSIPEPQGYVRVVLVDVSKGVGLHHIREGVDSVNSGSLWWELADTTTHGEMTLPYLATSAGTPSAAPTLAQMDCLFEWRNLIWASWAGALYYWAGPTGTTWSASQRALYATPTSSTTHVDSSGTLRCYVLQGTAIDYQPSTAASGTWTRVSSTDANYGVSFNSFIWTIGEETGVFKRHADGTAAWGSWTARQSLPIPPGGKILGLIIYRETDGDAAIHAKTTHGLWAYDDTNDKWYPTELRYPNHPDNRKAMTVWRGVPAGQNTEEAGLYLGVGMDIYAYVAGSSGNQAAVVNLGLTARDGVPVTWPADYNGLIVALAPSHNFMFALFDATGGVDNGGANAGTPNLTPKDSSTMFISTGLSWLAAWRSGRWHVFWEGAATDYPGRNLLVSGAYSEYRVYWDANNILYWMDINKGILSPTSLSTVPRAASGMVVWPWHYGSGPGAMDVMKRVISRVSGASATETVTISYGINREESTFTTAATRTTNGIVTTTLGDDADGNSAGVLFDFMRWRVQFARGGTNTTRPVLEYLAVDILPGTTTTHVWEATLDLRAFVGQRSQSGQLTELDDLLDPATQAMCIWRQQSSNTDEVHMCKLIKLEGAASAENNWESGIYKVSLLEI